jgi:hypothetical protein
MYLLASLLGKTSAGFASLRDIYCLGHTLRLRFLLFPLLLAASFASAQTSATTPSALWKQVKIEPIAALQVWATYTMGAEVYRPDEAKYEQVDDRLNFQLRRSRFGFKGNVGDRVKFNFTVAADLVGRDLLAGTDGGANNGPSPQVRLWNAYVQWRLSRENEKSYLVAGYQIPQIGRESITSALRSSSMEKAWVQNYLRRHLVGTGPGRAVGLNLGGLFLKEKLSWGYDIGVFNPSMQAYGNNSVGDVYSPLLTGRLVAYFGAPESKAYTTNHKLNYFGERRGLSLALAGAWQAKGDVFQDNYAYGFDFLGDYDGWSMDGEYMVLGRRGYEDISTAAQTAYLRLSYTLKVGEYWLEPSGMLAQLAGPLSAADQSAAAALSAFAGEERVFDLGSNFYFTPNLKLSMHYTFRKGDAGVAGAGATVNNYFFQSGVGPILRGDWLGLGLVAIM